MISNDTINKKPIIKINGEFQLDLTQPSFDFENNRLTVTKMYVASTEMAMRPDSVAVMLYGDAGKFDWVCKTNGISNPFSLSPGDPLYACDADSLKEAIVDPTRVQSKADSNDASSFYFDKDKLSKKDQNRLDFIKKKAASLINGATTIVPPNIADIGDKEITRKDGKVYFGNDVVTNVENCPENISRAKLKAKLIQNKLFGTI